MYTRINRCIHSVFQIILLLLHQARHVCVLLKNFDIDKKNCQSVRIRRNHVLFIKFEYKQKMTGHKRLSCLVFVSFFSFLLCAENIEKYNRIAWFAGRRTIRIMNYHYFPFRGRRSNYVQTKKAAGFLVCSITNIPNS